jgi:hypothetical protein
VSLSDTVVMVWRSRNIQLATFTGAIALSIVVFLSGAWWTKSLYDGVDRARMSDAGRDIRSRVMSMRQGLLVELSQWDRFVASYKDDSFLDRYDFVLVLNAQRQIEYAARRESKDKDMTAQSQTELSPWIDINAGLFDKLATENVLAGLLVYESKPLLIGSRFVVAKDGTASIFLVGRWLDARRLIPSAGLAENLFEVFVPDPRVGFPSDVENARNIMKGEDSYLGVLSRRGQGTGYLRFDDVFERTAFILKYSWQNHLSSSEHSSLFWLLLGSLFVGGSIHGISASSLAAWAKLKKKSQGFAGMNEKEMRGTVESFPGYALMINQKGAYISWSRSLSGVVGKEPSDFVGRKFGEVCSESGVHPQDLFHELKNSPKWPAMMEVEVRCQGLQHVVELKGTAHFVTGQNTILILIRSVDQPFEQATKADEASHTHLAA